MPNNTEISQEEQKKIIKIVTDFFLHQTNNDRKKADQLLVALSNAIKTQGVKLIHLDDNVYVVAVTGPGTVEIDNLSRRPATAKLAELIPILQQLGVQTAKMSTKERLDTKLKSAGVSFATTKGRNKETVYTMELA